ncbi:MAG: malectin domain-containing carbohydrate-binding protein [Verrucomicrobiota bacterium]
MRQLRSIVSAGVVFLLVGAQLRLQADSLSGAKVAVVCPRQSSCLEQLAAKEIRRYLYLRTGRLVPVINATGELPAGMDLIVLGRKETKLVQTVVQGDASLRREVEALGGEAYRLKSLLHNGRALLLIAGGDSPGTLYGAYQFVEHLGVGFYLHGDTVPDERIRLELPSLDEQGKPLFAIRGINPWNNFPQGPDWWNRDDYEAVIAQLPKLRMNFIGLHTYPERWDDAEPTVWVGLPGDSDKRGRVAFSNPSAYFTTLQIPERGKKAFAALPTGDYSFGGAQLFERDGWGPDVMLGRTPIPKTEKDCNALFNETGETMAKVYTLANTLGVRTCVGTEVPLTIPAKLRQKLQQQGRNPADPAVIRALYRGTFERIMKTHPLDYFWMWTPEGGDPWKSPRSIEQMAKDIVLAAEVAKELGAPFQVAYSGWRIGPKEDPLVFDRLLPPEIPLASLGGLYGKRPAAEEFALMKERRRWAIPWLEDDLSIVQPQLLVGRMRQDAVDALRLGCSGLLGIHWRTRGLGPNVSALADAAWKQDFRLTLSESDGAQVERIGGQALRVQGPIDGTDEDSVYRRIVVDPGVYRLRLPPGHYRVTLGFCEPTCREPNERVFGIKLQDKLVEEKLDIVARGGYRRSLNLAFDNVIVSDGWLEVRFLKYSDYLGMEGGEDKVTRLGYRGEPLIAAISAEGAGQVITINCGGGACKDYAADPTFGHDARFAPAADFYRAWTRREFGPDAHREIAAVFEHIDCRLPQVCGFPGSVTSSRHPWSQVALEYAFVDELAALQGRVKGAGNRDRFAYWLDTFGYMKAMAHVGCLLGELDGVMADIARETTAEAKKRLAEQRALPVRRQLVDCWGQMVTLLLKTVSNPGEMGMVTALESVGRARNQTFAKHDAVLSEALGRSLPADCQPWKDYRGPARVFVPTQRTLVVPGEQIRVKAIVLARHEPSRVIALWRPLGEGTFCQVELEHLARGVYSAMLPKRATRNDLEYYLEVVMQDGEMLQWPATAPAINQTLVVMPSEPLTGKSR